MINVFICDDDEIYLKHISEKAEKCISEQLHKESCIQCFTSIPELSENLRKTKIDVLFLDVVINGINAIEWLIEHQYEFKNLPVIIMTAFPFETDKLSEINFCYYIIKPKMTDDQLFRALERSITVSSRTDAKIETISVGGKNYTVNFNDILYIETMNNNIVIHMTDRKELTVYTTLKKFEERLPYNFLRCHKCYMVNMNHVCEYLPYAFILSNGFSVPIPPKKYRETINIYKKYILTL